MIKSNKTEVALISAATAMLAYIVSQDAKGNHLRAAIVTGVGLAVGSEIITYAMSDKRITSEHVNESVVDVTVKSSAAIAMAYLMQKVSNNAT